LSWAKIDSVSISKSQGTGKKFFWQNLVFAIFRLCPFGNIFSSQIWHFQTGQEILEIQQIGDLVKSKVYLSSTKMYLGLYIEEKLQVGCRVLGETGFKIHLAWGPVHRRLGKAWRGGWLVTSWGGKIVGGRPGGWDSWALRGRSIGTGGAWRWPVGVGRVTGLLIGNWPGRRVLSFQLVLVGLLLSGRGRRLWFYWRLAVTSMGLWVQILAIVLTKWSWELDCFRVLWRAPGILFTYFIFGRKIIWAFKADVRRLSNHGCLGLFSLAAH